MPMYLSVRTKILLSLCIVILIMSVTNVALVLQVLSYGRQYDAIIANITTANSISGHIKPEIDTEMWRIVAGKIDVDAGKQYDIINDVNAKVQQMTANTTSPRARIKLEGILRTMLTLTQDVNRMGQQIAAGSTTAENEAVLEDIRFVSDVVEQVVQDYALFEVQRTSNQYQHIRSKAEQILFTKPEILLDSSDIHYNRNKPHECHIAVMLQNSHSGLFHQIATKTAKPSIRVDQ